MRPAMTTVTVSNDTTDQDSPTQGVSVKLAKGVRNRTLDGLADGALMASFGRIANVSLTAQQRGAVLALTADQWRTVVDEAVRVLGSVLEEPFAAADLENRQYGDRALILDRVVGIEQQLGIHDLTAFTPQEV